MKLPEEVGGKTCRGNAERLFWSGKPTNVTAANGFVWPSTLPANFSPGWNGTELKFNPPGGRYGLCLHEVRLLGAAASKLPADKPAFPQKAPIQIQ